MFLFPPENSRGLLGILNKCRVLDVVEVAQVVGEGLDGGEDDGVTEDAGLHVVLGPPVEDQLVLAGETGAADRAVVLLLVLGCLVLQSGLVREEIFVAPGTPAPSEVVLEQKVSTAVSEDHVTDVAAVLLAGVTAGQQDTVLLSGRGAFPGLLGQGALTEVVLERTVREGFQQGKV